MRLRTLRRTEERERVKQQQSDASLRRWECLGAKDKRPAAELLNEDFGFKEPEKE